MSGGSERKNTADRVLRGVGLFTVMAGLCCFGPLLVLKSCWGAEHRRELGRVPSPDDRWELVAVGVSWGGAAGGAHHDYKLVRKGDEEKTGHLVLRVSEAQVQSKWLSNDHLHLTVLRPMTIYEIDPTLWRDYPRSEVKVSMDIRP